ncbi:MAG TPA: cupin domain-containing protein [Flexilinea sp.]|nr:cupin domain-containing protein [Flexilinea sp.]
MYKGVLQHMDIINENEKEYRFGDWGPKYIIKGPRMNMGIIRLKPGQKLTPHFHKVMEENFYIEKGNVQLNVDGTVYNLKPGDVVRCEPNEVHALANVSSEEARVIFMLAPYMESDKFEVEDTK